MRRALFAAALCVAAAGFAPGLGAEDALAERPSIAFEAASLAYGLAAGSPRISLSGKLPISERLSVQASPTAAWGGEEGARSVELALPLCIRGTIRLGRFEPYAAAGIELGWGRFSGGGDIVAAGPIVEAGKRLRLFRGDFFIEPYIGGAVMVTSGVDPTIKPSLYGGIRIGFGF